MSVLKTSCFDSLTSESITDRELPRVLPHGVWTKSDGQWEYLHEQALKMVATGYVCSSEAFTWEALLLARDSFSPIDPRIAASIANCAFFHGLNRDEKTAISMYSEAVQIWNACGPWVDTLKIERRARSSIFHLRMETRHWPVYEARQREKLMNLVDRGRAAVIALSKGQQIDLPGYTRWQKEKPTCPSDSRKLLSAALLIFRSRDASNTGLIVAPAQNIRCSTKPLNV